MVTPMTSPAHDLFPRFARARALDEQGQHDEALAEYRELLEDARSSHLTSSSLLAAAALASLRLDETEEAVRLAEAALHLDPLSLDACRALDVAAAQAGRRLAANDREPGDPETPRLYHLLVRAGRPDARSALALARFHEARGDRAVAAALRDAVRVIARDVPSPGEPPFQSEPDDRRTPIAFNVPGIGEA